MNNSRRTPLYLITEENGFFGQRLMPWQSIDTGRLGQLLEDQWEIQFITWSEIASGAELPKNATLIHSSSQQPEYKQYIDDILLYLHSAGHRVVPSLQITRCHENKGYQELHKRACGVKSITALYAGKLSDITEQAIDLPAVLKEIQGFGSSGVSLCRNWQALERSLKPRISDTISGHFSRMLSEAAYHFRRYILRRKGMRPYGDYFQAHRRFVVQELIPDLGHDFKVIIFPRRAFVAKRIVRDGDFRASGSGLLEWPDPPLELLRYASLIRRKFDEPYLSLDIVESNGEYHLIEFQGVHFGPLLIQEAPFHFTLRRERWEKTESRIDLESTLAEAIQDHLGENSR